MSEAVPRPPVPFTVIGGFLGAGKTTILNRLLATTMGERIAVLVNDFGSVNIDAALVAAHDGETIALTNGCICCALSDDLALQLPGLLERTPPIDRVVVEASGIADPGAVAQHGTRPGFRLDGVVVAVDVTTIVERTRDARTGHQVKHQLARADLFVLTHTDLTDDTTLVSVQALLEEVAPTVPSVRADRGHVPPAVLLGRTTGDPQPTEDPPAHGFETVALHLRDVITRQALLDALGRLGPGVLRVKGIVRLADDPDVATVVHMVGPRRRLRREPTLRVEQPVLVVIGVAGVAIVDAADAFGALRAP
jgi:G3E family GTPase